jgi:hypothetical protein
VTTLDRLLRQAEVAAGQLASSASRDLDAAMTRGAERSAAWPRLAAHGNRLLEAIGRHSPTLSRLTLATPVPVPASPQLLRLADLFGAAADLLHSSPEVVSSAAPIEWSRQHLLDGHPDVEAISAAVYAPLARAAAWTLEPLHVVAVDALWSSDVVQLGPIPMSLDQLLSEVADVAFSTHRGLTRIGNLTAPGDPLQHHLSAWERAAHEALRHEPHRHTLRLISYTLAALSAAAAHGIDSQTDGTSRGAADRLRAAATTSLRASRWPDHVRLEGQVDRSLALASHDLRNQLVPLRWPAGWPPGDSSDTTIQLLLNAAARVAHHHHDVMHTIPIWINSRHLAVGNHAPASARRKQRAEPDQAVKVTLEDRRQGRWIQLTPTTPHPELEKLRADSKRVAELLDSARHTPPTRTPEAVRRPPAAVRGAEHGPGEPLASARQLCSALDFSPPTGAGQAVRQSAQRAAGWHQLAQVGNRLLAALGSPSPALVSISESTPLPLPVDPSIRQITAAIAAAADHTREPDPVLHVEATEILRRVAEWTLTPYRRFGSDPGVLAGSLQRLLAEVAVHGPPLSSSADPIAAAIQAWQSAGRAALDSSPSASTMSHLSADLTQAITALSDATISLGEAGTVPADAVEAMLGHLTTARRASHVAAEWPAHLRTGDKQEDPAFLASSDKLRSGLQPASRWTTARSGLLVDSWLLVVASSDLAVRLAQVVNTQPIRASGEHSRRPSGREQPDVASRSRTTALELDAQLIETARLHPEYTNRELARLLGYSSPGQVNFRLNEARAEGLLPRSARAKYTVIGAGRAEYDLLASATRDLAASLVLVHGLLARTPQLSSPDPGPRRPAARPSHSTDRAEDMLPSATSRWEVVQPPNRRLDVPARSGLAGPRTIVP